MQQNLRPRKMFFTPNQLDCETLNFFAWTQIMQICDYCRGQRMLRKVLWRRSQSLREILSSIIFFCVYLWKFLLFSTWWSNHNWLTGNKRSIRWPDVFIKFLALGKDMGKQQKEISDKLLLVYGRWDSFWNEAEIKWNFNIFLKFTKRSFAGRIFPWDK